MSEEINESGETMVFSTFTKEIANSMREEINNNFSRLWIYVYNIDDKKFEIKVASNWGNKLDKPTLQKVKDFVEQHKLNKRTTTGALKS